MPCPSQGDLAPPGQAEGTRKTRRKPQRQQADRKRPNPGTDIDGEPLFGGKGHVLTQAVSPVVACTALGAPQGDGAGGLASCVLLHKLHRKVTCLLPLRNDGWIQGQTDHVEGAVMF